ncbi:YhfG family protein [Escherichia coli]|uniref:YhfG family protein n=1 Tax=Escherichia coli TaxID=562 RepID=UPI0021F4D496|nr:YhfG family protein [Escherichia coli]
MKKLTDKQKSRLWELQRNRNFQASRRLEGVEMPLVTLTALLLSRRNPDLPLILVANGHVQGGIK